MLTDAQKVDVRRWAGYQLQGSADSLSFSMPVFTENTLAGGNGLPGMTLDYRLDHLSASEETVLTGTFLTPMAKLETDILTAGDNLDTDVAAVWTRNVNEQRDRERLFNTWRRRMCAFLGLRPGPGLGTGRVSIERA